MESQRVLLIDDEISSRAPIAHFLRDIGYEVFEADHAENGLALLMEHDTDVVISDVRLAGMSGLELLQKIKVLARETQVILYTAYGTIEDAVSAMRIGAETYLTKPVNLEELELLVKRAFEKCALIRETQQLRKQLQQTKRFERLVGNHPSMQEIFKTIEQVSPSSANVLIYGESGTGKELVGEAIHNMSSRSDGPFVKVNCAVFTETLLESELFGHERGAFTGAFSRKVGRFELADHGSLFLDDINVMPEVTQVKILRFLQEREFERVGGNKTLKVDVRVIAATNTPLQEEVRKKRFREDLYYRLNVIPISLPPLRERRTDIPLLVEHFVRKYSERNDKDVLGFEDDAMALALAHDWPGNVRELENVVERAVIMTRSPYVTPHELPELNVTQLPERQAPTFAGRNLAELEREAIMQTLESVNGSTAKAADQLGISQRKIQYKLREYRKADPSAVPKEEGDA